MAIKAYNLLANGMGGIDWAGIPLVFGMLGISDPEPMIERLGAIKTHQPPRAD
jgi:hypothetical protein